MYEVIAFDADDTLWHNEDYFLNAEKKFSKMLTSFDSCLVKKTLSEVHIRNIKIYGYGIKGYILSMFETFIHFRKGEIKDIDVMKILNIGREMLGSPIDLIPNVLHVLKQLHKEYTMMIITKGDLIDQEKKIFSSGLSDFFKQIEIVSDKNKETYKKILYRYNIEPQQFLMVGNSMRSDIVPVVQIGANAVHIPYKTTWEYEKDHAQLDEREYSVLENIGSLPQFLNSKK